MTEQAIRKQIDVINRATEEALKSKESAHKFLVDAGIVKEKKIVKPSTKKRNNSWHSTNHFRQLASIAAIDKSV